jgi:CheY-like chemotaxis protein
MKILLLEDDPVLSDILTYHLRESGFEVIHVEDGENALESAYEHKFDLMILDINVPKKSGLEVLEEIRSEEDIKDIPVEIKVLEISFDLMENAQFDISPRPKNTMPKPKLMKIS